MTLLYVPIITLLIESAANVSGLRYLIIIHLGLIRFDQYMSTLSWQRQYPDPLLVFLDLVILNIIYCQAQLQKALSRYCGGKSNFVY